MGLCLPRVLWYNLPVGFVPLGFKTLKKSTFACCRKEDVVSYTGFCCNVRGPMVRRKRGWDLKAKDLGQFTV